MTKIEILRLIRLISVFEALVVQNEKTPDFVFDEVVALQKILEREMLS